MRPASDDGVGGRPAQVGGGVTVPAEHGPVRSPDTRAIETVLRAERAAEEAVAQATADATRLLSEARARARAIDVRADARAQRLRAAGVGLVARRTAALRAESAEREQRSRRSLTADAALQAAVQSVVDDLLNDGVPP